MLSASTTTPATWLTSAPRSSVESSCEGLTASEVAMHGHISFIFEYVLQLIVGLVGLVANTVAIPVLSSKEMRSFIFNRLLIFLAVFDNCYIVCSLSEAIRKQHAFNQLHELAFGHILYQLHNFVLCCSIYTTLALAVERYRAVWHPIEYHNRCQGVSPWPRVAAYMVPVVLFSALFSIPKFLEVEFVALGEQVVLPNGSVVTKDWLVASPTALRLNNTYVILYTNVARLLVQGVIPFVMLSKVNYRIYWVIKRRRLLSLRRRPNTISDRLTSELASQMTKANETLQAVVLTLIVLLFFVCHTPRFVLNVHEMMTLDSLRDSIAVADCTKLSVWALNAVAISHLLMTINSSANFFIYCFLSSPFRRTLTRMTINSLMVCKSHGDYSNGIDTDHAITHGHHLLHSDFGPQVDPNAATMSREHRGGSQEATF